MFAFTYRTERPITRTTNDVYGSHCEIEVGQEGLPVSGELKKVLHYIDLNEEQYRNNLAAYVKTKSVSSRQGYERGVWEAIKLTEKWAKKLDLEYEYFNVGEYNVGGEMKPIPPIITISWHHSYRSKTVLIYTYLDVLPPNKDQWTSDPFQMKEEDKVLFGSGAASGKGTLLCWFQVIEAFKQTNSPPSVNLLFVIESMYHNNHEGLSRFISSKRNTVFGDVNYVVVIDSQWLGNKTPNLVYGGVGMMHFDILIQKVENSPTDIKDDMVNIFKEIVNEDNEILIPHFFTNVAQVTPEEEHIYDVLKDFDADEIRDTLPPFMKQWNNRNILMHFWRHPSIWVGETEECTCSKQELDKVKRHFILKIVPNQIDARIRMVVTKHIENVVKKLGIENDVTCSMNCATRPWKFDYNSHLYLAARKAIKQVYHEEPNLVREDKARPIFNTLDQFFDTEKILIPVAKKGCNINEANENISVRDYLNVMRLMASFLFEL